MTTYDVIDAIYGEVLTIFPAYPIYKREKEDEKKFDFWIVINSLPIVDVESSQDISLLQTVSVNVNIHIIDLEKGKPDHVKLKADTKTLVDALPFMLSGIHVYFGRENVIRETDKMSHYSNIQLTVNLLNN